jgi:hypothetical protein
MPRIQERKGWHLLPSAGITLVGELRGRGSESLSKTLALNERLVGAMALGSRLLGLLPWGAYLSIGHGEATDKLGLGLAASIRPGNAALFVPVKKHDREQGAQGNSGR